MGKKIQCVGRYVMDGVTLGKGNFAHVELATHSVTQIKVAIKIIDTRKIRDEYVRSNLHREARLLATLRHPNIIRLYEALKAATLYCLVTEYASGGELLTHIKSQSGCRLGESGSRSFIRQLISAVIYLHGRCIVHRDLKMENIMLDEKKKHIKLIDFGLSNTYKPDEPLRTHCGSPEYAAPELFMVGRTYGPEIDVWSLGIIMYAMILGRLPFSTPFRDEFQRQRMLHQIQKGLSTSHEQELHLLTSDCRNLLHQLVEPNPELRIPLDEVQRHPWITKNGRSPFNPNVVPSSRNKIIRNQVVSELAELMDMKKGLVNEIVQENRADEMSAMYKMMMDERKKELGFYDIDHTRQPLKEYKSRSRSRSREREKVTASSVNREKAPKRKIQISAKKSSEKKAADKSSARSSQTTFEAEFLETPPPPLPQPLPLPFPLTLPSQPKEINSTKAAATVSSPPPTLLNTASPSPAPSVVVKPAACKVVELVVPVQPRPRPQLDRLSLTLDLSVVNLGNSARSRLVDAKMDAAGGGGGGSGGRTRPAIVDLSLGTAASSGVPPRLSPSDSQKRIQQQQQQQRQLPVSSSSKSRPQTSSHRSRRPSSFQYCFRPQTSSLTPSPNTPKENLRPAPLGLPPPPQRQAPRATPEESNIDGQSTTSSDSSIYDYTKNDLDLKEHHRHSPREKESGKLESDVVLNYSEHGSVHLPSTTGKEQTATGRAGVTERLAGTRETPRGSDQVECISSRSRIQVIQSAIFPDLHTMSRHPRVFPVIEDQDTSAINTLCFCDRQKQISITSEEDDDPLCRTTGHHHHPRPHHPPHHHRSPSSPFVVRCSRTSMSQNPVQFPDIQSSRQTPFPIAERNLRK